MYINRFPLHKGNNEGSTTRLSPSLCDVLLHCLLIGTISAAFVLFYGEQTLKEWFVVTAVGVGGVWMCLYTWKLSQRLPPLCYCLILLHVCMTETVRRRE